MSSASRPRPPHSQLRPSLQHRTLSSSLRSYGSPLIPRGDSRARRNQPNGALSPTQEVGENESLLGSRSGRKSFSAPSFHTFRTGSMNETERGDGDDDADMEAVQSDEQADSDGLYPPNCCWTTDGPQPPKRSDAYGIRDCDVYGNIHRVRQEIINCIDDPYSLEQLKAPRMNISVVRPLVDKFYTKQDLSLIFCLLVNRAQFIREQSYAAHHQTVNLTRALLCELLAEKVLRRYNELNPGPRGLLKLANILVAGFDAFQGAPESVLMDTSVLSLIESRQASRRRHHHKLTALEVAIVSESKSFLASTACQKVVDAIYRGKVVYSPSSYLEIIPDHWKKRPISLYDPRRAPVLNQYRLVVPRTRSWIELVQFTILLCLYIAVMTGRESRQTTTHTLLEVVFEVYACGWILDQLSCILEHGWHVYTQNLWSFLDVMFSLIFLTYLPLRIHGVRTAVNGEDPWGIAALDVLSCAAPVLIPRLAFNIMSENMLFLSLRAMMGDFITLTALAIWCFAGFLLSLKWLHNGLHNSYTISKWMIFVWFGLDGTGIDQAYTFHRILGPVLMILFAFLGNTLFLTILVSMLSNTFSMISANAVQEIQYRRSVLTFLGVKSDAIFAFMPPFNLAALIIFGPLKFILSARRFHSYYVFMVRVVNLPTLIALSWYERSTLWVSVQHRHVRPKRIDWKYQGGPRVVSTGWWSHTLQLWDFSQFSAHGDIQAVFDSDPPDDILNDDAIAQDNNLNKPELDDFDDIGPLSPNSGKMPREGIQAQFKMPFRSSSPQPQLSPETMTKDDQKSNYSNAIISTNPNTDNDNDSASSPATPRKPQSPHSPFPRRPSSRPQLDFRPKSNKSTRARRPRLSTIDSDAALRAEFHDSEEEQEVINRRKSRAFPSRQIKRPERKDSMIDYDPANVGAIEANARLSRLEKRLERMEGLLSRIADVATRDPESNDITTNNNIIVSGGGLGVEAVGESLDLQRIGSEVMPQAVRRSSLELGADGDSDNGSGIDADTENAVRRDILMERGP